MYMLPHCEESSPENGPRPVGTPYTDGSPAEACVMLDQCLSVVENNLRVCHALLPVSRANARENAVQELLHGACPSPDPCHGACLTLSLMSAQLVDAYAFG